MMFLPALLLAATPWWAVAQDGDPLKSPACGQALAVLQQARSAGAAPASVQPLRERAATACLGGGSTPQRSARMVQAPISVPPPVIAPPPEPPPVSIAPDLPPPPVAIQRPPQVTHCDSAGCWADDGRGLRQLGPGMAGPRGLCTRQGGLVYCP